MIELFGEFYRIQRYGHIAGLRISVLDIIVFPNHIVVGWHRAEQGNQFVDFHFDKMTNRAAMARRIRKRSRLIQRGDRTQSQGQVMCPVSLRPIKRTVSRPGRPIPPELELELDMVDGDSVEDLSSCRGLPVSPLQFGGLSVCFV